MKDNAFILFSITSCGNHQGTETESPKKDQIPQHDDAHLLKERLDKLHKGGKWLAVFPKEDLNYDAAIALFMIKKKAGQYRGEAGI